MSRKDARPTATKPRAKAAGPLEDLPEKELPSVIPNGVLPAETDVPVPINSFEAHIGYSSLMRQMHRSYARFVAYYRSKAGGSLSIEDARAAAFHAPVDEKEADDLLNEMMRLPFESLNFIDLQKLQAVAPKTAEMFWELVKNEGRKEFESGYLAANITFPVGYMKEVWNIARYLGVRESFIEEWKPKGGIEISLIDMLAQTYFQWQFWMEETVKRSQTRERLPHHEYAEWMERKGQDAKAYGYDDGYWTRPTISEAHALDQAEQMADRWNRMYMRTLRQLRDLRRYSTVMINQPSQVNIANDSGQQINIASDRRNHRAVHKEGEEGAAC